MNRSATGTATRPCHSSLRSRPSRLGLLASAYSPRPSLALAKAVLLISLSLLTLALLSAPPAQAQGGYPGGGSGGGGWVPSDASGTPLSSNDYGYDANTGGANLLPSGQQPTISNTYPIPDSADQWWFGAYYPNKYSVNNGDDHYGYGGLYSSNTAGNSTRDNYGTLATSYDPINYGWDRPDNLALPPDLTGSVHADNTDTLKAYFVWTGDPAQIPTHADFLLRTSVSASASVNFGNAGATSGLSATATATLGRTA